MGGAELSIPIVGGGFKVGRSGSYCHAIVRVVDDNDDDVGKEGVCAPIVRGCLRAHGSDPEVKTANRPVAGSPIGR